MTDDEVLTQKSQTFNQKTLNISQETGQGRKNENPEGNSSTKIGLTDFSVA